MGRSELTELTRPKRVSKWLAAAGDVDTSGTICGDVLDRR